ncbi:MAG: hypothetical protein OXB84_03865, partial [Halobacteriovoraceae bacterium]|nr:hypothetical protein [Halobacteriovoraceae bacterium]
MIEGSLITANSRFIVQRLEQFPLSFPLDAFCYMETAIEASSGLSLAARERFIFFSLPVKELVTKKAEMAIGVEVIGVAEPEFSRDTRLAVCDF